ncbi:hypothetical protein [Neobacillus sp. YIM B06451]|uniref:hypothetical protein n=1 Tax=Neobacillus sp. YIM B06451 TaxID=3070994 RepID=UPI00292F230D|nr:hypothetical protein [Neobacillus sp. YIM B06451]
MTNEKQRQLFETLKLIKDQWVEISIIKHENCLENKEAQNEIIEAVLYSVMEMIDGYNDNLTFSLDLIDKDTKQSLKEGIELHDQFMNYLYEAEKERY